MTLTDTILDIPDILLGQAQDENALTGLTVLLAPKGATAGAALRGGGSGTRELNLFDPATTTDIVHGLVLSGGSAFGLDAAGGVMAWLEERNIGFDTGVAKVPLVAQAILFDLAIGDAGIRPGFAMAQAACDNATDQGTSIAQGNFGAGTGATIGKLRQGLGAMKGGIGTASLQLTNGFTVGAIVAVNALGDVYEDGQIIAGMLVPDNKGKPVFADSSRCLLSMGAEMAAPAFTSNTTIGIIATNGDFNKNQCNKIASLGHNGMARAIRPIHTTMDGDMLFALATGQRAAATPSVDVAGEMATIVVERAIIKAIKAAQPAGGLPSWQSFNQVGS